MACLKCGKKTKDEQSFCPRCLEAMEAYPVKENVHIQLPNHPEWADGKKPPRKRRPLSAEEINVLLRKRIRRLRRIALVLALLLCVAAFLFVKDWFF